MVQFLKDLAVNNNREWFNANRDRYEENRNKILFITEVLINEIRKFDRDIPAMDPKECMFRIFRDVRFSNDKRPYKTNFGSFIAKGGRKSERTGYYFHVEPEQSFAGGGIYMPAAAPLKAVRTQIEQHPQEFLDIIDDKEFKSYFPELYDHKLKTAPKGFPKDHKYIDLLRYKSYVFSYSIKNDILTGEKFIDHIVQSFRQLHKMNAFLNEGLDNFLEKK